MYAANDIDICGAKPKGGGLEKVDSYENIGSCGFGEHKELSSTTMDEKAMLSPSTCMLMDDSTEKGKEEENDEKCQQVDSEDDDDLSAFVDTEA